MAQALITYDTVHGNTRTIANAIAEGLKASGVGDVVVKGLKEVQESEFREADAILVGGPNHIGGPTRSVKKTIRRIAANDLSGKTIGFFDTYLGGDFRKAVGKMEAELKKRSDRANIVSPGGSFRVNGMKGPIADGEPAKAQEFGKLVASRLTP